MKKVWSKPVAQFQNFMPNEYVAVCWGVRCDTVKANAYERKIGNALSIHTYWNCGQLDHQYLVDIDGDGKADSMVEIDSPYGDDLVCTFYTDDTYTNTIPINQLQLSSGANIYWSTTGSNIFGAKTYHHQGVIDNYDENHENRS